MDDEPGVARPRLERTLTPARGGINSASGKAITAGLGRFGPWLRHGRTYAGIPKDEDVLTIGLKRAVMLIAEKEAGGGRTGF